MESDFELDGRVQVYITFHYFQNNEFQSIREPGIIQSYKNTYLNWLCLRFVS